MSPVLSIFGHRLSTRPPVLRFGALTLLALATLLLFFAKLHNGPSNPSNYSYQPSRPAGKRPEQPLLEQPQGHLSAFTPVVLSLCETLPDPGNIAVVVLTAGTEAHQRLPTLLETTLACVESPLLFSDLQQTLGIYKIHDILSEGAVAATARGKETGWELYHEQQRLVLQQRQGELASLGFGYDWVKSKEVLEKVKILRMLGKAWELQPGRDWYVFFGSDVFVAWPALVGWLEGLEKGGMRFWGSVPSFSRDGAKGSGLFVLSGRAVEAWALQEARVLPGWEAKVADAELKGGEALLKKVLQKELGLTVTVAAALTGGVASAFPFTQEKWCQPVMSVGNTTVRELDALFQMQAADLKKRLLQRDVFALSTRREGILPKREAWDNLADDPVYAIEPFSGGTVDPHVSFEACETACQRAEECLQFVFVSTAGKNEDGSTGVHGECFMSKAFRLGIQRGATLEEKGFSRTSGWSPRVANWVHSKTYCPLYGSEEQ